MKTLYMMVGLPGSGKSTYIKNHLLPNDIWISRDKIRFSLLKEGEDYFTHEKQVFKVWVNEINAAIENPNISTIWVDATHLNEKSRNKILDKLGLRNVNIIPIVFNLPLDVCLKRNAGRTGIAYIPESALRRMWYLQTNPKEDTKHSYYDIIEVNE